LESVFISLQQLSLADLEKALDQIHPAPFKTIALTQENNSLAFQTALTTRLHHLENSCCDSTCPWEAWMALMGDRYIQDSLHQQLGFNSTSGGGLLGVDYTYLSFTGGLLSGYLYTTEHWNQKRARGILDSYYAALYGSWNPRYLSLSLNWMPSWNFFRGKRFISWNGLNRTARHREKGFQWDARIRLSTALKIKNYFTFSPLGLFDWIQDRQKGYTESGAQSLDLKVDPQSSRLLRTELGAAFSRNFFYRELCLTPRLQATWIREMRHNSRLTAHLKGEGGHFTVIGLFPTRSLVGVEAALDGTFCRRGSFSLGYRGEFSSSSQNHQVTVEGGVAF
jgi:outer membrane autotransporter protein